MPPYSFKNLPRREMLSSIALLAAMSCGASTLAAEQVVATGVIDNDGIQLANGDSLTNSGTIINSAGLAVFHPSPNTGTIAFILNTETGTITGTGDSAIDINGNLASFENNGVVTADTDVALWVSGGLGSFLNTGTVTSTTRSAMVIEYQAGSFNNSGIINGAGNEAALFYGGVTSFVNSGTIRNTDARGSKGDGVAFNTDAVYGGAVGSFENSGTITSDMTSGSNGDGVLFYDYGVGVLQTGSFINSGIISGLGSGVSSSGGFASFSNTSAGVITGVEDYGLSSYGPVGSFSNAGSISSTNAEGVFIRRAVGSFSNTGSISSEASAVYLQGDVDTFTNSGTISSINRQGVYIHAVGNFTNNGSISSTSSYNDHGVYIYREVGSFTNSGIISSVNGRGASFDSTVGSFNNSGSISSTNNDGIGFNGPVTTFTNSGSIVSKNGFGVRIGEPGGTFTNTGTITGSSAAIGYNLNNSGANTVVNSGELIGTNGIALNFDGGADGDDTLKILDGSRIKGDIVFGGGTDVLDVSDFTGNALLRASDLENVVAGDTLYYRDQASGEIAIVDESGIAAASSAVTAGDITLHLQNVLASQLSTLGSGTAQDDAVLNYGPTPVQSEAAVAIGDNTDLAPNRAVWGSVIGGGSSDDDPNLSNVFGGIVIGSHAQISGNTTIGVLGSYVASSLDIGDTQTIDSDTGALGVYGRSEFGTIDLDYSLLAGFIGNSSERAMVSLGEDETASADYSSWFVSPSVGIAIPVLGNASGELRVASRLSYVGGQAEGYSETGSSVNLTVGDQDIGLLDARFGLDGTIWGAPSAAGAVTFTANAGLFVQSNFGNASTPVSFLGQTQTVASADATTYGLYGGVGLSAEAAANLSIDASLDGQVDTDGLASGAAKAGLVGKF